MNTKATIGLMVLTAIGTYGVSHSRRHHFEPTKVGDGSILLDTETGVECSARFGMKWTDANKKGVWAAGLAAKKTEDAYASYVSSHQKAISLGDIAPSGTSSLTDIAPAIAKPTPTGRIDLSGGLEPAPVDATFENLYSSMEDADSRYNALVEKADSEKVPDPDSSYFKSFPLCKDVR